MVKQRGSIDGFIPRRPGVNLGETGASNQRPNISRRQLNISTDHTPNTMNTEAKRPNGEISTERADLEDSLRGLDERGTTTAAPKLTRKQKRKLKKDSNKKKPSTRKKKIIKWSNIGLVILLVLGGGWLGYRALVASNNIFSGNILDVFKNKPLAQDENGRSNILILGTTEDDPDRPGAALTDSMMVLSVDQTKKDAYMISIPRDLWVDYGRQCDNGYQGKINAYFQCVRKSASPEDESKANTVVGKLVGKTLGLDIQYGANINRKGLKDLVKAVGGIDVTIKSRNPNGLLDSNFDKPMCGAGKVSLAEQKKRCPPDGHYIDFPNGDVHLDANQAVYLSRARGYRAPTYGFERSNFDREKNQQMILKGIQKKATSAGTLTNIAKVSGLIDAIGDNLQTTFETSEIGTLVDLGNSIPQSDIVSISLIDAEPTILTTDGLNGQSIVRPVAGLMDYSKMQDYIQQRLVYGDVAREKAKTVVFNASNQEGIAGLQADKLKSRGLKITKVDNTDGQYTGVSVYQVGEGNEATRKMLEELFSIKVNQSQPPVTVSEGTEFVVILGSGAIVAG
ncbi:MAG: LCP family protein [bacterium]|nr:LCP family protein [bacterium]